MTFDGDELNILGLMDEHVKYMFRKFDPQYAVIDRDTGLLNKAFSITKGQKIDLLNFCIC